MLVNSKKIRSRTSFSSLRVFFTKQSRNAFKEWIAAAQTARLAMTSSCNIFATLRLNYSQCLSLSNLVCFWVIFTLLLSPVSFAADDNQILLEETINQFLTPGHTLSGAEQEKFFAIMDNAVRNGAKLAEINTDPQLNNLPIFKVCQNIIERVEKLFNPSVYLNWILSHRLSNGVSNADLLAKPEKLISLAMEKGVDVRQICNANPQVGDIFRQIYDLLHAAKNYL